MNARRAAAPHARFSGSTTIEAVRASLAGAGLALDCGYGPRPLVYADFGASGRPSALIDERVGAISALYANPHNEDSATGQAATRALHAACARIKAALGAGPDHALIACGSGATGAIAKLQEVLGLSLPPATRAFLRRRMGPDFEARLESRRPVVFLGPYEHHSNELGWRESLAEIVPVGLNEDGGIDLDALDARLADPRYQGRQKIGAFSAASNVTGVKTDVAALARLLHRHGAILALDCAASAPYMPIDLSPEDPAEAPDAISLSPHKMAGGPGACGLLVIRKTLYRHDLAPTVAGGGTVRYVTPDDHDFIADVEARERAGTPGLPQIVRAAEALELPGEIGWDEIARVEHGHLSAAIAAFETDPCVEILGPADPDRRIALFSFLVRPGGGDPLHPRLVARLLNDLYGIQARAGCSCAGPYGHHLLKLDRETTRAHRAAVLDGYAGLRPGWVRVSFHWTMSAAERDYVIAAIGQIARYGARFAADYRFDPKTGAWTNGREPLAGDHAPDLAACLAAAEALAGERSERPVEITLPAEHESLLRYAGLRAGGRVAEPAGA
ncbi:MAG: aminotransferase class V-fold PLP-dependent enzyme [Oceanicaulis sp.]